jgi:beta-glucanase (GH16 family)
MRTSKTGLRVLIAGAVVSVAVVLAGCSGPSPDSTSATSGITVPSPDATQTESTTEYQSAAVRYDWGKVVAGDEFNYTGAPKVSKWQVYDSIGHDGQGLRSPSAFAVKNGVVRISGDAKGTTGGMAAQFDNVKYGKWEVRMRVSERDPKYHPVLLLWPDSEKWPCDGEVDFAEGWSKTDIVNFVLISGCEDTVTRMFTTVDQTQWHDYAVEWTATAMVGYIDGVEVFRDTTASHLPPGPMHMTMQLDWFPDGTTTIPSWMDVDWVRFYH